jgi:hypothetical protein
MSTVAQSDNAADAGLRAAEDSREENRPPRTRRTGEGCFGSKTAPPRRLGLIKFASAYLTRRSIQAIFTVSRARQRSGRRGLARSCPKEWHKGIRRRIRSKPGAGHFGRVPALCVDAMSSVFAASTGGMYDSLTFTNETVDGAKVFGKIMLC